MQTKIALAVTASCLAEVARVRVAPRDDAEQVTQLLRGEPVTVLETRDGWARIRTAYDYPGWIHQDALVDGAGTLTGASPCVDPVEAARSFLGAPYEWG